MNGTNSKINMLKDPYVQTPSGLMNAKRLQSAAIQGKLRHKMISGGVLHEGKSKSSLKDNYATVASLTGLEYAKPSVKIQAPLSVYYGKSTSGLKSRQSKQTNIAVRNGRSADAYEMLIQHDKLTQKQKQYITLHRGRK